LFCLRKINTRLGVTVIPPFPVVCVQLKII
jgi:hypothetical protein